MRVNERTITLTPDTNQFYDVYLKLSLNGLPIASGGGGTPTPFDPPDCANFGDVVQVAVGTSPPGYGDFAFGAAPTPGNLLVYVTGGGGGGGTTPSSPPYDGLTPPGPRTWEFVRTQMPMSTAMWYRVVELGDPAAWHGTLPINDRTVCVEFGGPFAAAVLDPGTDVGRSYVYVTDPEPQCLVDITPSPGQPVLLVSAAFAGFDAGAWTGFPAVPAAGMTTVYGGALNQTHVSIDVSKRVVTDPSGAYTVGITGWSTPYEAQAVLAAAFVQGDCDEPPNRGQLITREFIADGDDATSSWATRWPYAAGSLHVWVDGREIVAGLTPLDPGAGTFSIDFMPIGVRGDSPAERVTASYQAMPGG